MHRIGLTTAGGADPQHRIDAMGIKVERATGQCGLLHLRAEALAVEHEARRMRAAGEFIAGYFRAFAGAAAFMDDVLDRCRAAGHVATMLGRRRAITGVRDRDKRRNAAGVMTLTLPEREAVNTVVALLLGVGALAALPLLGAGALGGPLESGDGRLVLTAGLLHFAVLFEGNNAYGYDGPALWWEVGAGADGGRLSRSKALASLAVMAPAAVVLVVLLALISGGWSWLPAGLLLVTGSILLATGASVLSAALAPFALPDSPNPLAAGDAGQGCLAGSVLMVGMVVLTIVSVPIALAVVWAVGRGPTTTAFVSLLAPVVGAVLLALALVAARALLGGREAELVAKVTPAR